MATATIMYGRREGKSRNYPSELPRLMAQGINPKEVAVLQPKDIDRIQKSLARYNEQAEKVEIQRKDREMLRLKSKELVKDWGNTIEGQRLKKLQARKIREQHEEVERKKIDIEEAQYQAQKRKEAIEKARQLQYYETDRVKQFHGVLLLTEVLKERDAQIAMKHAKKEWQKYRDEEYFELERKNHDDMLQADRQKSEESFQKTFDVAQFQKLQKQDKDNELQQEKVSGVQEGKMIKQQFETFEASKKAIEEKRLLKKIQLMHGYKNQIALIKEKEKQDRLDEEEKNEKIRKFGRAKKKMALMRKQKEQELFDAFQEKIEVMSDKLHASMLEKIDDEDERIAKTVAERELKRIEEDESKQKKILETLSAIQEHRLEMIDEANKQLEENKAINRRLLQCQLKEDRKFQAKLAKERQEKKNYAVQQQRKQQKQINDKRAKKQAENDEQLTLDTRNTELLVQEEEDFQRYAQAVIEDAKNGGRNTFPLIKAARDGPGGGRGPKCEGNAGLRPSYIVSDSTGVQLPHFAKDEMLCNRTYGHVGKSGKRIGFNW